MKPHATTLITNCPECASSEVPPTVWYLPDGSKTCPHLFLMQDYDVRRRLKLKVRSLRREPKLSYLHYAVTLTTLPGILNPAHVAVTKLRKYINSKQFRPTESWVACLEKPHSNAHIHISVDTKKYVPAKDVLKMNKARVEVKSLTNAKALLKWRKYIVKEVDDDPDKVIFKTMDDIDRYLKNKMLV